MAEGFLSEQEVMARLGIAKADLDRLIEEGLLSVVDQEGQRAFSEEEVNALELAEPLEAVPVEEEVPFQDLGETVSDEAGPGGLFDFSEDLETELMAESGPALGETVGEAEPVAAEDEPSEGDMITEVLEIGEEEVAEEDLLGDIIEDVSGEEEFHVTVEEDRTEELVGEDTVGVGATEELTSEPTADVVVSDEDTAEITQLGEESFEGEELEEILAGEEAMEAEEAEEGIEMPYEGVTMAPAEAPMPVWAVVVLAIVLVTQVIAGLFVIGNVMIPKHSPDWLTSINLFSE